MATADEFHILPPHVVLDYFSLTLEEKIYALTIETPLDLRTLELFTVHSIRQGDLPFFEYLMKKEKRLCPDWKRLGSLSYKFLLCQACEYSQPVIVKWLLDHMPDHHKFLDAQEKYRRSVQDIHLNCDRRRCVDYQWVFESIAKSGSVECFEMLRLHAPLSLDHNRATVKQLKTVHSGLTEHIAKVVQ